MKLSLLPQLLQGGWRSLDWGQKPFPPEFFPALLDSLAQAFVVHAQNVLEWLQSGQVGMPIESIAPNLRPPFLIMFFEMVTEARGHRSECGVLLQWPDPEDEVHHGVYFTVFERMDGGCPYYFLGGKVSIDDEYRPTSVLCDAEVPEDVLVLAKASLTTALCSVSFFHCKNVTIRKVESTCKHPAKFRKFHGYSLPSFHVIEVHKATKHTVSQSSDDHEQAVRAKTTFVRGHFKKYTADGKLFGKVEGLWFWDMHVRGSGVPLRSEYRPWPPEGKHRKVCIVQSGGSR